VQVKAMLKADPDLGKNSKQVQAVVWAVADGVASVSKRGRLSLCFLAANRLPPTLLAGLKDAALQVG
jgi:hypothetical protein